MNKLHKIAISTLLLGGIMGYIAGEYDGKIIEPTAKFMTDRDINTSDIPKSEICTLKGNANSRLGGGGSYTPHVFFQGIDRIAVYFDYQGTFDEVAIACIDENIASACKRLDEMYPAGMGVDLSDIRTTLKPVMPSTLKPHIINVLSANVQHCKKDIPITFHYRKTDDEFYMKGTLAAMIKLDINQREKTLIVGGALYRPDVGFNFFDKMRYDEIELPLDLENPKELHKKIHHFLKHPLR
jgi:hypothetical protein